MLSSGCTDQNTAKNYSRISTVHFVLSLSWALTSPKSLQKSYILVFYSVNCFQSCVHAQGPASKRRLKCASGKAQCLAILLLAFRCEM